MVYLSKIYTKTGDDGTTGLGDGSRVEKDDLRIEAYGTVDELNSVMGLMVSSVEQFPQGELVERITNDLLDLGADLCVPLPADESKELAGTVLRITEGHVSRLESAIDHFNADLEPLKSFVLPGGTTASAWCHLARTVCRRAERRLVSLQRQASINPQTLVYLNRLSDLLFVLARFLNDRGKSDILWKPGLGQSG